MAVKKQSRWNGSPRNVAAVVIKTTAPSPESLFAIHKMTTRRFAGRDQRTSAVTVSRFQSAWRSAGLLVPKQNLMDKLKKIEFFANIFLGARSLLGHQCCRWLLRGTELQ